VIDRNGNLVSTITDPTIQGPWDSALFDEGGHAKLFVSNALSGTVVALELILSEWEQVNVARPSAKPQCWELIASNRSINWRTAFHASVSLTIAPSTNS
jgi:hypothetical protein